ncbi:DUF3492 domain-containing protein [bacterium]|nr:DUF3492 domain-containing protein [bacterium]
MSSRPQSDVCLILEGTYPYVVGGVSAWVHDLILSLPDTKFSLLCIQPKDDELARKYVLPKNVVDIVDVRLQVLPKGAEKVPTDLFARMKPHVDAMFTGQGHMDNLRAMIDLIRAYPGIGSHVLLDSEASWEMMTEIYEEHHAESSFLDFFWSWRSLMGGLFSLLLADAPKAKVYHALSTGFAGIMAARLAHETGGRCALTEHGIYTNERRIEINMADWIGDESPIHLGMDRPIKDLRQMWMDAFMSYANICYEAADPIVTLFQGNQRAQIEGGADPRKLQVIPNGIDFQRYSSLGHSPAERPTVAFIGRVVPIKDVKTFIRACAVVKQHIPNLDAYILGPTDEDPEYFEECKQLVAHLMLEGNITFTGKVEVEKYLPMVDLMVMTSISEAQPLVLLEAGAAGIPSVVTDVGACRELVMGTEDEDPALGAGGAVTGLASSQETAQAIISLLTDADRYNEASKAIRRRVQTYYRKDMQIEAYKKLYSDLVSKPTIRKVA